jgi:hypothetical protein
MNKESLPDLSPVKNNKNNENKGFGMMQRLTMYNSGSHQHQPHAKTQLLNHIMQ